MTIVVLRPVLAAVLVVAASGCIDWDSLSGTPCDRSQGLVAYWPFDEGGGTVAADASASNMPAALYGNTSWVPGHIGSALEFAGPTDFAIFQASPGLSFGGGHGAFTVSYWISPSSLTSTSEIRPFEIGTCTGMAYIAASITAAGVVGFVGYDDAGRSARTDSAPGAVRIGQWTHVAHVLDRAVGTGTTYIAGAASGTSADLTAWTGIIDCSVAQSASFGGWIDSFNYAGAIDDVRIFGRALSPAEVADLSQLSSSACPW